MRPVPKLKRGFNFQPTPKRILNFKRNLSQISSLFSSGQKKRRRKQANKATHHLSGRNHPRILLSECEFASQQAPGRPTHHILAAHIEEASRVSRNQIGSPDSSSPRPSTTPVDHVTKGGSITGLPASGFQLDLCTKATSLPRSWLPPHSPLAAAPPRPTGSRLAAETPQASPGASRHAPLRQLGGRKLTLGSIDPCKPPCHWRSQIRSGQSRCRITTSDKSNSHRLIHNERIIPRLRRRPPFEPRTFFFLTFLSLSSISAHSNTSHSQTANSLCAPQIHARTRSSPQRFDTRLP